MIDASVLIPVSNASDAIAKQLPRLIGAVEKLRKTFEIIIIDDHSSQLEAERLAKLSAKRPCLRILRLDQSHGAAVAISAGLAEARGRELLAVPAGGQYSDDEIARMFKGLARADLVYARPQVRGVAKSWQRLRRIPRWVLLGLQIREPDSPLWAARSEALAGVQLPRGMYRYLPTLVAMRGFRVAEVSTRRLKHPHQLRDSAANPGDLLCAWWLSRRWRNYSAEELTPPRLGVAKLRQGASSAGPPASSATHPTSRIKRSA